MVLSIGTVQSAWGNGCRQQIGGSIGNRLRQVRKENETKEGRTAVIAGVDSTATLRKSISESSSYGYIFDMMFR